MLHNVRKYSETFNTSDYRNSFYKRIYELETFGLDHWQGAGTRDEVRAPAPGCTKDYVLQVAPLSVNAVGAASLLVQVPWKPTVTEPLTGIEPL
jgi:hypothetical protein